MGLDGHRVATEGRCGDPACRRPRGCGKRTQKRVGAGKKNAGTWSCKGQKRAGPLRGATLKRHQASLATAGGRQGANDEANAMEVEAKDDGGRPKGDSLREEKEVPRLPTPGGRAHPLESGRAVENNSEVARPGAAPRANPDAGRPRPIRVGSRTQAAARFFPRATCQDPACPQRAQGQRCRTRLRVGGVLGGEASGTPTAWPS